ncbi:hypothetical protein EZ313_13895 [Ramlibacter henchirensis]|uniref:Collagen-like protein n=1 Tax=Ramlibacter henchirensis TaxID=204072 RepID=A0A4Z0BST3_9BURK|nr:hypothetical protein [Ramlibacter henchirensis]TFZ02356.1 hypothetical protein EZ313_13895 [Ramlibacter henchirensis]
MTLRAIALAVVAAAALSACGRGADSGATANPSAQGSPGKGNAVEQARVPLRGDGPPGGSSGAKGSAPHTGASGGDAVPGTTGRGTADAGGRSQTPGPGTGTTGGLGASQGQTATMGAAPSGGTATSGSSNSTSGSAVGGR